VRLALVSANQKSSLEVNGWNESQHTISEVNEMRKTSLAVSFALMLLLAAGAMRVVSAQAQRPQTIAPVLRPTTTTLTGTVLANTAAAPWIIFKWGPAKNDILHILVSNATSFVQNGRPVSRSAVQVNMQAQVTGYYYGTQISFGTKFNATKVVILPALQTGTANSARLPSGYHPPAPQSGPPSNGPLRAAPPPPAYGRASAPPPQFRPAPAPAASPQAPSQPYTARPTARTMGTPQGATVNGVRILAKLIAGRCVPGNPTREHFVGSIYVNGKPEVALQYRWIRSDGATGPVVSVNATSTRQLNVRDEWDIQSPSPSGWEAIQIVSLDGQPSQIESNQAAFACSASTPTNAANAAGAANQSSAGSQAPGSARPPFNSNNPQPNGNRQATPPQLTPAQKAQLAQRQAAMQAKLQVMAQQERQRFQVYKAKFQLQQIDRHVGLLNAALQHSSCASTGCRAALQNRIANANGIRANIAHTMQPVTHLTESLLRNQGSAVQRTNPNPGAHPFGGGTHLGSAAQPGNPNAGKRPVSGGCTVPQINPLSVSQGQPGDPVTINGYGFGANPGQINFIVNPGQTVQASADYWSDTQIITSVPQVSGILGYSGNVFVVTCQQSNAVPFQFNPEIDVEQLPIAGNDAAFGDASCGPDICVSVHRIKADGSVSNLLIAGGFTGRRGDDIFFQGYQLKNGWVLDSVNLSLGQASDKRNGAQIGADSVGSSSPSVDIHWWDSPALGSASYTLAMYVHGPAGVPYQ